MWSSSLHVLREPTPCALKQATATAQSAAPTQQPPHPEPASQPSTDLTSAQSAAVQSTSSTATSSPALTPQAAPPEPTQAEPSRSTASATPSSGAPKPKSAKAKPKPEAVSPAKPMVPPEPQPALKILDWPTAERPIPATNRELTCDLFSGIGEGPPVDPDYLQHRHEAGQQASNSKSTPQKAYFDTLKRTVKTLGEAFPCPPAILQFIDLPPRSPSAERRNSPRRMSEEQYDTLRNLLGPGCIFPPDLIPKSRLPKPQPSGPQPMASKMQGTPKTQPPLSAAARAQLELFKSCVDNSDTTPFTCPPQIYDFLHFPRRSRSAQRRGSPQRMTEQQHDMIKDIMGPNCIFPPHMLPKSRLPKAKPKPTGPKPMAPKTSETQPPSTAPRPTPPEAQSAPSASTSSSSSSLVSLLGMPSILDQLQNLPKCTRGRSATPRRSPRSTLVQVDSSGHPIKTLATQVAPILSAGEPTSDPQSSTPPSSTSRRTRTPSATLTDRRSTTPSGDSLQTSIDVDEPTQQRQLDPDENEFAEEILRETQPDRIPEIIDRFKSGAKVPPLEQAYAANANHDKLMMLDVERVDISGEGFDPFQFPGNTFAMLTDVWKPENEGFSLDAFKSTAKVQGSTNSRKRPMTFLIMEIAWAILLQDGTIEWDSYRVILPMSLGRLYAHEKTVKEGRRRPDYKCNTIDVRSAIWAYNNLHHLPWDPRITMTGRNKPVTLKTALTRLDDFYRRHHCTACCTKGPQSEADVIERFIKFIRPDSPILFQNTGSNDGRTHHRHPQTYFHIVCIVRDQNPHDHAADANFQPPDPDAHCSAVEVIYYVAYYLSTFFGPLRDPPRRTDLRFPPCIRDPTIDRG